MTFESVSASPGLCQRILPSGGFDDRVLFEDLTSAPLSLLASQSQRICQEEGREDEPGDKDAWYRAGHFQRTEQAALEAEGVVSMLEKGCEVALNPELVPAGDSISSAHISRAAGMYCGPLAPCPLCCSVSSPVQSPSMAQISPLLEADS